MLKLLFIAAGGLSGIVGWASFSAPNWDPKNLWRITVNNKFYLSSCFNDPYDKSGKTTVSDLSIYLTTKDTVSEIKDSTQLELRAKGYRKKVENNKTYLAKRYENKSLQKNIVSGNSGNTSDYQIRKYKDSGNIKLGETGGGVDSETFGGDITCNNKFFDLEGDSSGVIDIDLSKVTFKLKDDENGNNKYNGHKVYSIEITTNDSGNKKLKWADSFEKPIVIIPSDQR